MGNVMILALKTVIALSLAGSVVVQAMVLPAAWTDLSDADVPAWGQITLISIAAAGVICMQVFAACVWRLLTLVRTGAVFSKASFGYINVIIGAFAVASALAMALAAVLAPGGIAPGFVGLVAGASLVLAGIALLVVVMRRLLVQAIARETEVRTLRSELDEVV